MQHTASMNDPIIHETLTEVLRRLDVLEAAVLHDNKRNAARLLRALRSSIVPELACALRARLGVGKREFDRCLARLAEEGHTIEAKKGRRNGVWLRLVPPECDTLPIQPPV